MLMLENQTKKNLENLLETKLDYLDSLTISDELQLVSDSSQKSSKLNISFSKNKDLRKIGRGSPVLARKRFKTMEDVNKGLDKIR